MADSKVDAPPAPKARQSSRLRWWFSSVVVVLLLSRVWLHLQTQDEYTLCSPTNSIYTVNETQPRAQCISVRNGRIEAIGNDVDVKRNWFARILDPFNGQVRYLEPEQIIVPGLAGICPSFQVFARASTYPDAHAHLLEQGYKMQLQLDGSKSVQEVVDRIKAYIIAHPDVHADPSRWIEGMGWDQTKWPGAEFPTAADLSADPLLRGRPILLMRVDVHAAWVSERVLEIMAPLPPDSDVEGGSIIRDAAGEPTGIFVDNAMMLIPRPPWAPEQYTDFFNTAVAEALKYGLTSIHDASTDPAAVAFFKGVAETGNLPASSSLILWCKCTENFTGWEPSKIDRLTNHGVHGKLNLRAVKLFTDGALGSWGAALIAPYSDKPDYSGIMRTSPETMNELIRTAWRAKMQVNVHCIGDRANEVVLDIFENILEEEAHNGDADVAAFRPRIEHSQILQPSDLVRIGKLGVLASVQPTHGTSDMGYAETRLGPDRIKGAYAYRTLLEASPNKILPLGSDFPVEGVNPLLGFYAAVTRLDVAGNSPHGDGGWFPSERLTRAQALKGMTLDAAYASFTETELGSLTVGKRADFVLLDRNIMEVEAAEILKAKAICTVIDGKVEYGSLGGRIMWW
ncbi:amidohydrolase family-domain-containing protein [Mycena alexandri]|uniref:Amidohydrolase family-domain-containing protein n=1 Tax=Mycena alexandri TaxID=1745969 RepID=A0AAD6T4D1_9AGAR|nr:amidohydrolase family-domain-containing protein [Mycena alexandri]